VEDKQKGWRKLQDVRFDKRKLSKRAKKVSNATQRHAHRFIIRRIENARLVSRQIITWLVLVGMVVAGMGIQLLWNQRGFMTQARAAGGLYVEGVVGPLTTLNPIYATTSADASVARLVFSALYDYDTTGSLRQDIATGMQISDDGRIYTISLRDDMRWHDGEKLTANDVAFTIETVKNAAVRSPLRVNWIDVDVKAASENTVVFTLPTTYAAFAHALTFPILPQHILKDVPATALRESTFSQAPVGSGAFAFRRLQAADTLSQHRTVHLAANQEYSRGVVKLARFELQVFDNEEDLLSAIKAGELSGASDLSPTYVGEVSKQYEVTSAALNSGVYLIFNTTNPILRDTAIRQALQIGTDTANVRKSIGGGVLPLDLPVLASQLSGIETPKAPSTDVNKANEILEGAGWKLVGSTRVKDGQKLSIRLTTSKKPEYDKVAQLVKDQWRKLGIDVQIYSVDASSASSVFVQDTLQGRNFDVLLYELAIGADPDVYAYWHSSQIGQTGYNFASYSDPIADASLASARTRLEPELRSAKYVTFIQRWLEDAPAIALYQSVVEYVTNKNVEAVSPSARLVTASDRYANVAYWTMSDDSVYKTP
jgi:peptide/nickel transport system substrate-binding protein